MNEWSVLSKKVSCKSKNFGNIDLEFSKQVMESILCNIVNARNKSPSIWYLQDLSPLFLDVTFDLPSDLFEVFHSQMNIYLVDHVV